MIEEAMKQNTGLIINLILLILLIFTLATVFEMPSSDSKVDIVNGFLDLRRWDQTGNAIMNLDGEWYFYWSSFVTQIEPPDAYTKLPANFRNAEYTIPSDSFFSVEELSFTGYASYGLVIDGYSVLKRPALYMQGVSINYRILVNGELVTEAGRVGKSKESSSGFDRTAVYFLPESSSDRTELIIQVSNYFNDKGGIRERIFIGEADELLEKLRLEYYREALVFGALLIISFYHVGFFLYRNKSKSALYLGIFTLVMAFRSLAYGEATLQVFIPGFDWVVLSKTGMITFYLGGPLFLQYMKYLFMGKTHEWLHRFSILLALLLSVLIWFLPYEWMLSLLLPYQIISMSYILYSMYISFRSIREHSRRSILVLVSIFIILIIGINDILVSWDLIPMPFLLPFGILFFVMIHVNLLSASYARSFEKIQVLSASQEQLLEKQKQTEIALESTVLERTQALRMSRDEAEDANKAKSKFLAMMSHEMRTPLNGITGFAELILESNSLKEQHAYAAFIVDESLRLRALIDELLDLTKISEGKKKVELSHFELHQFIERLISPYKMQALGKNLDFQVFYDMPNPKLSIFSDQNLLSQVLINLLANALEYTSVGSIVLKVSWKESGSRTLLRFSVKDSGEGIPAEHQEHLFDRFYQSPDSHEGGTGLGLAISKEIVDLLGGEISVISTAGEGAEFSFFVPVQIGPVVAGGHDISQQVENLRLDGVRVLLVDDSDMNRQLFLIHLNKLGARVRVALNGKEAVEFASKKSYDLILMDVLMPVMDGLEATRIIRMDSKNYKTPILGITANAYAEQIQECLVAGMDGVVPKPFKKIQLLEAIHRLLYSVDHPFLDREDFKVPKNTINLEGSAQKISLVNFNESGELDESAFLSIQESVIDEFLRLKAALASAIENQNVESVHRTVHSIKGAALNIFAEDLAEQALAIELKAKESQIPVTVENIEEFMLEIENTIAQLQKLNSFNS
jgi:signal transduction histidine kinase/DNA-binding response OmpR family regulator